MKPIVVLSLLRRVISDEKTQCTSTHQRAKAERESSSSSTTCKRRSKVMLVIAQITVASATFITLLSLYIQWLSK